MLWGHNIHISDHSQHNYYADFVILIRVVRILQ